MSQLLVVYLDSIDEHLLEYLDGEEELRLDVVDRLRHFTAALLVGAFTAVYIPEQLQALHDAATFLESPGSAIALADSDRDFLTALERLWGMYREIRSAG